MITRSKTLAPLLVCLAMAALAAGCGEKEEPATTGAQVTTQPVTSTTSTTTTPTDEGLEPKELVMLFLTGNPQDSIDLCAEGITPEFLREAYGGRTGCVASRKPSALASSAIVTPGTSSGVKATLTARPKGGTYDGDKLTVTVVSSGDTWQISELRSDAPVGP